ncbi:MAG: flagellar FlbD family protein [Actinomycetota bacterium]|nr:flagellar FlbD family protein [Actinomycetota bacterium]MDA8208068.1 flagellar FlbD family protein [Actinomycetota bacterium]
MIRVTRLQGATMAINAELIERIESTPDTVITLVGGAHYVVAEPVEELLERIIEYRASIIRQVSRPADDPGAGRLHLVDDGG